MIHRIKNLLSGKKGRFYKLCRSNNLTLDYRNNQTEIEILKDIFSDREYSDYFPFYEKATVVDIGAHYGYFSIFAAKNLNERSTIISIEPNSGNFNHLQKNISDSKIKNVQCYNLALGDKKGTSKLYKGLNANHSIVDSYVLSNKDKSFEEIEVKTFEELVNELKLEKIDFVKMDCEGAEYSIFNSTPDSVFGKISTISMEFHDLKNEDFSANLLLEKLTRNNFKIVKFHYQKTSMNLNYGKLIGTKIIDQ